MMDTRVVDKVILARDLLYERLLANLRITRGEAGSPAFLEDDKHTSHIGLYSSAGLLEIFGKENKHDIAFYDLFVNAFSKKIGLDVEEPDTKVLRDANNIFKLCAVLSSLKRVDPQKRSEKFTRLYIYTAEKILSMISDVGYCKYSKYADNLSGSDYVLSTSIALIALHGTSVDSQVLHMPRKYLENWLRRVLEGKPNTAATLIPEIAVCAYALEATKDVSPTSLNKYHNTHIALLLYKFFIGHEEFVEQTVRVFSVVRNEYHSSTYSFLIDYYIIHYFILTHSVYLRSKFLIRKIANLAEHIINNGKFVSSIDGQSFTKTNVVVFELFNLILQNKQLFRSSFALALYFESRKQPIYSGIKRKIKYAVGMSVALFISLFYFIVFASNVDQKWEFVASATAGIIATLVYEWISD